MRAKDGAKGPALQPGPRKHRPHRPLPFPCFLQNGSPRPLHPRWLLQDCGRLETRPPTLTSAPDFSSVASIAHLLYSRQAPAGFAKPKACVRYFRSLFPSAVSAGANIVLLSS